MKNLNRFSLMFLYLACLSGSLWLGSYLSKLFISYRLFEDTDFILKSYLNNTNLSEILLTLYPIFTISLVLYIIFIISFVLFLVLSKINLKQNGWLFIITILVFVTFPFEVYLSNLDYKIIILMNDRAFDANSVVALIKERFQVFSSFPVIEIFCYFAIIFLSIFKPLSRGKINLIG